MRWRRGSWLLPSCLAFGCLPSYVDNSGAGTRKALISESIPLTFNDPFVKVAEPEQPIANSRSYLLRVGEQVLGFLDAAQLVPGHTVTMWYVTFGDPEKCLEPYTCNVVDFVNPRINSAFYHSGAGGFVTNEGHVRIAGYPIVNGEREKLRVGSTLKDALTSEIQMVTRTHGPPIAGLEAEQIGTWFGGCARTGDPRANFECYSPVYARHRVLDARRTLASEGPMLQGEPADADVPLEGTHCLLARSEALGVVMGYVDATQLNPQDVISVSWHVFNAPESCGLGVGRCTLDDIANPAVEATVIDQRGGIVDAGGRLYLPIGPLRGNELGIVRVGTGEVRTASAEIVIVLRSHGAPIADRLEEQLTNYEGACDVANCVNVQFARLAAPTPTAP